MPSRRRVSAPANRVYESGPVLQQARFESPPSKSKPKRIRSYGKKTTVRVPKTKDNTLTQMGWVIDNSPPQLSESEDVSEDENKEDEGDYEEAAKNRRSKRRRTMGDTPSVTPKLYHTQTISQVVRSFNSNNSFDEDELASGVEEERFVPQKKDIYDVPSSLPAITRAPKPTPRRGRSAALGKENIPPVVVSRKEVVQEDTLLVKSPARGLMPPPETPHRTSYTEIPSSQSPATPLTLPSIKSTRTPFTEQPVNIPINFGVRQTPRDNSPRKTQEDIPATRAKLPVSILSKGRKDADFSVTMDKIESMAPPESKTVESPRFWNQNPRRTGEISPLKAPVLEIKDTYDTATEVNQISHITPTLEIRDTFESATEVSQMIRIPSSPPAWTRSSPIKSVRFDIPFEIEGQLTPTKGMLSDMEEPVFLSSSTLQTNREILDSDAESDEEDLAEEYEQLAGHVNAEDATAENSDEHTENEDEEAGFVDLLEEARKDRRNDVIAKNKTKYPDEDGSQNDALGATESVELPHNDATMAETKFIDEEDEVDEIVLSSHARGPSPDLDAESDYGDIGVETQYQVDKLTSSSHISLKPEDNNPPEPEPEPDPETCAEMTQYMETQRIATQHVNNMAARTGESDVFISMAPSEVTSFRDRTRNHFIRIWKLPPHVSRVWIYELQPVSALQYMVEISVPKRPGQLPQDGMGNEEFNIRPKNTTYSAYGILQFYELLNPVSYSTLMERGWFENTPKKYGYVAPAVIDELMSNLKPPLFAIHDGDAEEQIWQSSETDTQEVTGQLMSNIQQFTQVATVPVAEDEVEMEKEDEIPSSPFKLPPPRHRALQIEEQEHGMPVPSQATTVDLSQVQTPRHRRQRSVEMVLESPSRPTMSSTPQLPRHRSPKSMKRGAGLGSSSGLERSSSGRGGDEDHEHEQQSLMPFSMASSQLQLLTKSQLLSESLLQDSVPEPPEWVGESEDEDYL